MSAKTSRFWLNWSVVLAFLGGGLAVAGMAFVNMGASFGFSQVNGLDDIPEGIILWDPEDRVVTFNKVYKKLFPSGADLMYAGQTFEEYAQGRAESGEVPEAIGRESDWEAERVRSHREDPQENEYFRDDRWFLIRDSRLPDGSMITFFSDITKRKQAEEELKTAQARMVDAFDSIFGGVDLYDAEDRLVLSSTGNRHFDPEMDDLFVLGSSFESILRQAVERGLLPVAGDRPEAWIQNRFAQHRDRKGVPQVVNAKGRWVQIDEFETHDGGTLVIRTDVTEKKQAEESHIRFIQTLDVAPEGTILWDADDHFVMTNGGYQELMPSTSDLLRPEMTYEEFSRERAMSGEVPMAKGREEAWVSEHMKNHEKQSIEAEMLRNGRWLHLRENKLADGSTLCFLSDITERKREEEALETTQTRLMDAINSISGSLIFTTRKTGWS